VAGLWFSAGTPVSSTNKTYHHDITAILLKVVLNTIALTITLKQRTLKNPSKNVAYLYIKS
jgi:hypothetical protein